MAAFSSPPKRQGEACFSGVQTGKCSAKTTGSSAGEESASLEEKNCLRKEDSIVESSPIDYDIFAEYCTDKSWMDIMEEEAMKDASSREPNKFVQSSNRPSSAEVKGDTDFSRFMNADESTVGPPTALGPSEQPKRKRPNLSDMLNDESWKKCRRISFLNQEDTRDVGNISEEESLSSEYLHDSESTLQERKHSIPVTESPTETAKILLNSLEVVSKKPRRIGPTLRPHYVSPKSGWEWNEDVLKQRSRDLSKGYNSDVYKRYLTKYPKKNRVKNMHPVTPNKYLKTSRRSWDMQVRIWRRSIYAFMGESIESDSSIYASSLSANSTSDSCDSDLSRQSSTSHSECSSVVSDEHPFASGEDTLTG